MAGDWIKMRMDLQTHPKVVRILSATGSDKFRVIGGLHAVWCVFDQHSEDGSLRGYTPCLLDHIIGWDGFSDAMIAVGWLCFDGEETLTMPGFSDHNGRSAKRRGEDQKRKQAVRKVSAKCPQEEKTDCGPEKRREEKNTDPSVVSPPGRRKKPRTQIPEDFNPDDSLLNWAKENTPKPDPLAETRKFVDHHRSKGNVFADHKAAWRTWMHKAQEFAKDKKKPNGQAWGDHMMVDFDAVVREEREQERRKAQA